MKKFLGKAAVSFFLLLLFTPFAYAQQGQTPAAATGGSQFSLLPFTNVPYDQCKKDMASFEAKPTDGQVAEIKSDRDHILGCAIKTGRITFGMVPYFLTYLTNFLLGMSGIISILFIVIGGYHYVIGGLSEEKEKGKNTIKYALMGMGLALLAWTIVTVIINAVTG